MNKYYGFSNRINNLINDAVDSMNFGSLGQDINNLFRTSVDEDIKLSKEEETSYTEQTDYKEQTDYRNNRYWYTSKVPIIPSPSGAVSGTVMLVLGILITLVFASTTVGLTFMTVSAFEGLLGVAVFSLLATAGGVSLIVAGIRTRQIVKRFKEYVRLIGQKDFIKIADLAVQIGRSPKKIIKDLQLMIRRHWFLEGHIDQRQEYFIGNNDTYKKHLDSQQQFQKRKAQEEAEAARRAGETEEETQLRLVLEKGLESVAEIRKANDLLPGEHISSQLDQLETLVGKIFKRVSEKPSLLPDIRKFMDYYLPTTLKLVHVYTDFEQKNIDIHQVKKARNEIETTLDTIIEAFKQLLSELYQDTVMDVNADISVLKTMFAKDGLSGNEFDMNK